VSRTGDTLKKEKEVFISVIFIESGLYGFSLVKTFYIRFVSFVSLSLII